MAIAMRFLCARNLAELMRKSIWMRVAAWSLSRRGRGGLAAVEEGAGFLPMSCPNKPSFDRSSASMRFFSASCAAIFASNSSFSRCFSNASSSASLRMRSASSCSFWRFFSSRCRTYEGTSKGWWVSYGYRGFIGYSLPSFLSLFLCV